MSSLLSDFSAGASERGAESMDSMRAPLDPQAGEPPRPRPPRGFSLFWRTFLLLILLLTASAIGWYQLFQRLEYQPRIINNARQVATLVNLSRAALAHSDGIERIALLKTLAQQEGVRVLTREQADQYEPFTESALQRRVADELVARLGAGTLVAGRVNGEPGLWISFSINGDASYWVRVDRSRVRALWSNGTWLLWLTTLLALSLGGAVVLARLINRPLQQLLSAATRVRDGNWRDRLDENVRIHEIRQVNVGFNRMVDQISRVERDRAEMLAGISHDLRTPLARLRLEIEMSVPDPDTRELMAADIAQVDAVIEKFLDYARPSRAAPRALPLADLVYACAQPFIARDDVEIQMDIAPDLCVMGDAIDLRRVLSNLLENALRHGRTPDTGMTRVRMIAVADDRTVTLRVRDYGPGVPDEMLDNLSRPFYRGDSARTSATGTGLGLAIVAKVVRDMGGVLRFGNSRSGGLIAELRLPRPPAAPPSVE
jgi:two-component system osmolarity sensor histidine kinase EnvZ